MLHESSDWQLYRVAKLVRDDLDDHSFIPSQRAVKLKIAVDTRATTAPRT